MVAMMFNLPSSTRYHQLPPRPLLDRSGAVVVPNYMWELATIAAGVQDLDEEFAKREPFDQMYEKILIADSRLRALAYKTPSTWWEPCEKLDARHFSQLLHAYVSVRIHLHSIMRGDAHGQYAYSRTTCIDACHKAVRRYLVLRRLLPQGFFLIRILHMQIFTIGIVLLLSQYREAKQSLISNQFELNQKMSSVSEIIESLDRDAKDTKLEFPAEAAAALRSLQGWLLTPESFSSNNLALRVPTLGKVLVKKKEETQHRPMMDSVSMTVSDQHGSAADTQWSAMDDISSDESYAWLLELDIDTFWDDSFLNAGSYDVDA